MFRLRNSNHQRKFKAKKFPPCDLGAHDIRTLSCGLFAQYNGYLEEASDVFQETTCLKPENGKEGLTPDFKTILEWVIEQLRQNPNMAKCDTLVAISDTRSLEDIAHWKHTSRWITERTRWRGPDDDTWYALFVPSGHFKCHFVWSAVYILKALLPFFPGTDLVLFDHDAAFTTLFENKQLCSLAQNCHLPYRMNVSHLGCLIITEPWSPANAGIVWFPRRPRNLGSEADFRQAAALLTAICSETRATTGC